MKNQVVILLIAVISVFVLSSCASQSSAPKNVIIVIGDGAGFNQLQAASLYLHGEMDALTSQKLPVKLAATTYSTNGHGYDPEQVQVDFDYLKKRATDSAASGTALSTGTKTYNGAIGVDTLKQPLTHVFSMAEKKNKSTGVVTSVPFSHATPAAFIAHNENRNNYHEIAEEMIMQSAAEVIIGCGHPFYDGDNNRVAEPNYKQVSEQVWNAVQEARAGADADGDGVADPWTFVESREDFQNLADGDAPKRLLGIPQVPSTLQVNRSGGDEQTEPYMPPLTENIPTLAELSKAAINVLDDNPNGFYLMIEAGAIDWACHGNNGPRMMEEAVDMENTVKAVVTWVETNSSWDETLVIVTADHETGYLNGPGSGVSMSDAGATKAVYQQLENNGAQQMPGVEFHSGGHTNQLVPVLMKGVGAEGYIDLAGKNDPTHGAYIDNTDIAKYLKTFLR